MCNFFSFVTQPDERPNERFYFDWMNRVERNHEDCDSHSTICKRFNLDEDKSNKYEYNPLTKVLTVDQINNELDDRLQVEAWCEQLDWKRIVAPLIVKPIVHPLEIEAGEVTDEVIDLLKQWASVGAYVSGFFDIQYDHDFAPCTQLWERGFVPSFDGAIWRLHAGKGSEVVYEWAVN